MLGAPMGLDKAACATATNAVSRFRFRIGLACSMALVEAVFWTSAATWAVMKGQTVLIPGACLRAILMLVMGVAAGYQKVWAYWTLIILWGLTSLLGITLAIAGARAPLAQNVAGVSITILNTIFCALAVRELRRNSRSR